MVTKEYMAGEWYSSLPRIEVRAGAEATHQLSYIGQDKKWALAVLKGVDIDDLDNGLDDAKGYRSLSHGPSPEIVMQSQLKKNRPIFFHGSRDFKARVLIKKTFA